MENQEGPAGRDQPTGSGAPGAASVQEVASQVQQTIGTTFEQARQQGIGHLDAQKDKAAETVGGVAQALRQTGSHLREGNQDFVADVVDRAASELEQFSGQLRDQDVDQLLQDVEGFARRQPAVFVGGAVMLGLFAARFLRSSRPTFDSGYAAGPYPTFGGTPPMSGIGTPGTWSPGSGMPMPGPGSPGYGSGTWTGTSPAPTMPSTSTVPTPDTTSPVEECEPSVSESE